MTLLASANLSTIASKYLAGMLGKDVLGQGELVVVGLKRVLYECPVSSMLDQ